MNCLHDFFFLELSKVQTVSESCRLNVFLQMVQMNEASPWTSRLWWFNAVLVGFILWQISHTCGESVWIFICLFNVPRFLSQAPQIVHWTRGSSMPMCCVFIWSWNPSFVLKTLAQTSHIRWSIRSCTFKMCIFSIWSDLKLLEKENEFLNLILWFFQNFLFSNRAFAYLLLFTNFADEFLITDWMYVA